MTATNIRKYIPALTVSFVVAMGLYISVVLVTGYDDIAHGIAKISWQALILILALSLANYLLRFVRWHWYFNELGYSIPWKFNLYCYFSGFAFTTTPAKAGEAVRSFYLRRHNVRFAHSLAALISERMCDIVSISVLSLLVYFLLAQYGTIAAVCVALLVLLTLMVQSKWIRKWIRALPLRRFPRLSKLYLSVLDLLDNSAELLEPRRFTVGLLLSLVAWGAEAVAFYLLLAELGIPATLTVGMGIYAFSMLVGAISFIPAGLGTTEATMIGMLLLLGAPAADAVAATVVCRFTTLWFAVVLGLIAVVALEMRHPDLQIAHKDMRVP